MRIQCIIMLLLIEVLFLTALQQKRSDQVMTHRDAVLGMLGQYLKGIEFHTCMSLRADIHESVTQSRPSLAAAKHMYSWAYLVHIGLLSHERACCQGAILPLCRSLFAKPSHDDGEI